MKYLFRTIIIILACLLTFLLVGCSNDETTESLTDNTSSIVDTASSTALPVTDNSVTAQPTTEEFSVSTEEGVYEPIEEVVESSGIYRITEAGTYSFEGYLEGQVLVEAGENDEVVIELNGVTITNSEDSPIKILSALSVDISAKSGTENIINDNRSTKSKEDETQGEGAIYAKCDLKIKGSGTLVVNGTYNNGIHTTKDLKIQKVSLKVSAFNNALKGNDSITISSGIVIAISTNGDGIKTENTDLNKNGQTRGDIVIEGGSVAVYAAGDGIQAAHDFEISTNNEDNVAPSLNIYTGSYSGYTAKSASTTSYKGIKVQNELRVHSGSINIESYDDGLHADYGTKFTSEEVGIGTITIDGGGLVINVYSPTTSTGGGRPGPQSGWGGQKGVSGADAIHADYTLNIIGGTIEIDSAYEGLEANIINVSGGKTYVIGNDDGINACKGVATPEVNVSGGYLDVTVSPNGDTDGIDSNGTYVQTGGIVITRGPNMEMMAALDTDRGATISGGTLIVLGYASVKRSSDVQSKSMSLHTSGNHTITVDGVSYTFTNKYSYSRTTVYSSSDISS